MESYLITEIKKLAEELVKNLKQKRVDEVEISADINFFIMPLCELWGHGVAVKIEKKVFVYIIVEKACSRIYIRKSKLYEKYPWEYRKTVEEIMQKYDIF